MIVPSTPSRRVLTGLLGRFAAPRGVEPRRGEAGARAGRRWLAPLLGGAAALAMMAAPAEAVTTLSIAPIAWDIIGLDSNDVTVGPNHFPIGARVCNTGGVAAVNVISTFVWDSTNTLINLRGGTNTVLTVPSLAAGACTDSYFEVEVTRNAAAYNTTRRYHITASADAGATPTVSTPVPREVFIERLISQSRNAVNDMQISSDGGSTYSSVAAGGTMTLLVGNTYDIKLVGATATQGYEQIESFINFPNTIFQVLAVNATYSAEDSPTFNPPYDKLYGNACNWEASPVSPNYRSCNGVGKAGGSITVNYRVKILAVPGAPLVNPEPLSTLIHDFSGSSYHYNADYGVSTRYAYVLDPSTLTISKAFNSSAIIPGATSALTITIPNPSTGPLTGVNFTDIFPILPAAMVVAPGPVFSTSGCGSPTFAPTAGAGSISFSNGTIPGSGTCVISVNVTAPIAGTYVNTTGHLFINGTTPGSGFDTNKTASASLVVAPSGVACVEGVTLARWSIPSAMTPVTNPPDLAGGVPSFRAANVNTATAVATTPAETTTALAGSTIVRVPAVPATNSWSIRHLKNATLNTLQLAMQTKNFGNVTMDFDWTQASPANGPTAGNITTGSGTPWSLTSLLTPTPVAGWRIGPTVSGLPTAANTTFTINLTGAANDNASVEFDNIVFKGCSYVPPPTLSKSFGTSPIVVGGTSLLTFNIGNNISSIYDQMNLVDVNFTDTLPTGLVIDTSTAPSTTCVSTSGAPRVLTATNNTTLISLTGIELVPGPTAACTVTVLVRGVTGGTYLNQSGYIAGSVDGTSYPNQTPTGYGTASITVIAPPVIAKSFAAATILTGASTRLTLTVTNPNVTQSLSGVAFTDGLPSGLVVASTPNLSTTCTGTTTANALATSVTLSGATLGGLGSCTISVDVTGNTPGTKTNNVLVTSTEAGNGNTATASVVVKDPTPAISILKQVGPTASGPWTSFLARSVGADVFYQITVENVGDVALTSVSVSDPQITLTGCSFASSLSVGSTTSCVVGPVAAGPTVGSPYPNTATATGMYFSTTVSDSSTATYSTTALTIVKVAAESSFNAQGVTLNYSYGVTNTGASPLAGPVVVADDKSSTETCPNVNTVGNFNSNLDPGETLICTATYVTTASDVSNGFVTNIATATAASVTSNTATKTVPMASAIDLAVAKTDGALVIQYGSSTTYTIVVVNNGPSVDGATVTDPAVSGLTKTTVGPCTAFGGATCPASGLFTPSNLESGIAIPSLPNGGSISFPVTVTVNTTSPFTNTVTVTRQTLALAEVTTANNSASDTDTLLKNWGHLPSAYANMNLLANNGARTVTGPTRLGTLVTSGPDGVNNANFTPRSSDDGVTWSPAVAWSYASGGSVDVTVTCPSGPCYLNGWFDWDFNNSLLETDNRTFSNIAVVNGNNTLTFPIPSYGQLDGLKYIYARFRVSNQPMGSVVPNQEATSGGAVPLVGEIEDYVFQVANGFVPTPVTVAFFRTRQGTGHTVFFRWSTASETGNVGFNLYAKKNGRLIRINEGIIPSKVIDSLDRVDYAFRAEVDADAFIIEDVGVAGERRRHGPFRLGEVYGGQLHEERIQWARIAEEHAAARATDQSEIARGQAAVWGFASSSQPATVLLEVAKTGMYRVTYEQLVAAGAQPSDSKLSLFSRGGQVPVYMPFKSFGPGAYFEFYGEALGSWYTDTNVYALKFSKTGGTKNIQEVNGAPDLTVPVPATYTETFLLDRHLGYAEHAPGNNPWFDTLMFTFSSPRAFDVPLTLEGIVDESLPATLEVVVWGYGAWEPNPDHHVIVSLNGIQVLDRSFDGPIENKWKVSLPAGTLHNGTNTLRFTTPGDTGAPWDISYFARASVTYERAIDAKDGRLSFTAPGTALRVGNLPSNDVVVYRLDNNGPERLRNVLVQPGATGYSATFASKNNGGTNIVSTGAALYTPTLRLTATRSDLNKAAQYLIISHPDFITGLDPLVAARQRQGLTVNVVDVDDIYASYSFGVFDPQAIKSYIAFAARSLGTRSVLLVGGDTYDYRNYLARNSVSFIPSIYSSTSEKVHFVPTDPSYADVDNDGVPDLAIGRFPVRTRADLDAIVAKTLSYQTKSYPRTALFVSDAHDGGLSFKNYNLSFMNTLPAGWAASGISLDDADVTTTRNQLLAGMNQGTAVVTFTGHSATREWTFSNLFTTSYAATLTNAGKPFIAVQWGCWNTYYVDPVYNHMVQALLFSPDRGAAAVLGAVTLTDAGSEYLLGKLLTPRMSTKGVSIGSALLDAKRELAKQHPELADVLIGWTLMGDPELVVDP